MVRLADQKPSRATDQQGPSRIFRKETRSCDVCQKEYETTIICKPDEEDRVWRKECPGCFNQAQFQRTKDEALSRLPSVIQETRLQWSEEAGLLGNLGAKSFQNFERNLQPKAFDTVKNLDYHYDQEAETAGRSLVMSSPDNYGLGKTHLVCALVNNIIETETVAYVSSRGQITTRRCPVLYRTENKLLARIRATFSRAQMNKYDNEPAPENEEAIYHELRLIPLLIIDDLGKVRPRDFSFLQGVYFRVIDDRYTEERPIILTTNLSLAELEEHIGGACADRLREMCGENFLVMKGESYRRKRQ